MKTNVIAILAVAVILLLGTVLLIESPTVQLKTKHAWGITNSKCDNDCKGRPYNGVVCGTFSRVCCANGRCSTFGNCAERVLVPGCTEEYTATQCQADCTQGLTICNNRNGRSCCAYGCNPSGGCRVGPNNVPGSVRLVGCKSTFI